MKKLGLLGKNISHSKSQQMYEELLGEAVDYSLFDFDDISKIPSLDFFFSNVDGLSITAPYKKVFIEKVVLENEIKQLGAINCVKKEGNSFYGTNTDYKAVIELLGLYIDKSVVILGDGSMAKITTSALSAKEKDFVQYSRRLNGEISKLDLSNLSNALVINTCSRDFIYEGALSNNTIFWDYNYSNKPQSHIIEDKCTYIDGLTLLKLQAKFALDFWKINR